ncbi:ferrochelatase-2, chloroplastic-like [Senna tora]|uniref:Ferrochelatase-2, chloroplastic-like n=1 Tax=Senna tora TaxID=362788 RepID=A0A834WTC4_9FABA|nr:ferrochelatase-2, chloroplastic-like [Senna tora]
MKFPYEFDLFGDSSSSSSAPTSPIESVAGSTKTKSTNDVDEDFFAALTRQLSRRVHMKAFFRELSIGTAHGSLENVVLCEDQFILVLGDAGGVGTLVIKAEELRKSLWAKNAPAKVYVGTRYCHPFTEEALEQVFDNLDLSLQCELGYHFINFVLPIGELNVDVAKLAADRMKYCCSVSSSCR